MVVRIGIPVPTAADPAYNNTCWGQYAQAVAQAGGVAVRMELGLDDGALAELAGGCDGFVLPGSPADVEPASYGAEREAATAAADPARDHGDRVLLAHAAATGKPVLAICFGVQLLNVWRGGTLAQDLPPVPVNHAAGAAVGVAHGVQVAPESLLAGLLSGAEAPREGDFRRLAVNSSHHQAVSSPGEDLAIVARSVEDGVIEAVEGRVGEAAMLGVQWHPERSVGISAASRALFTWVVAEAEDRRLHRRLEGGDGDTE